jgi:membrane-bound ClpP family serine protease
MDDYLTIALVLFFIGAAFLAAEVLLPTGGIFVVVSLLFFAVGVGIIFAWGTNTEAAVATGGLALAFPVACYIAVTAWKQFAIGSALSAEEMVDISHAGGSSDLETLKNHTGKTVSPMRPSGTVEFDGRRIDAMTEGVMLEAGVWVRCVEVKTGKVIVRQIESPADIANIELNEPWPDDSFPPDVAAPPHPTTDTSSPPSKKPLDDFDDLDLGFDK